MTSSYQPRQGGMIQIVNDEVTSKLEADGSKRADVAESAALEDRYIKAYLERNSKRAQSALSSTDTNERDLAEAQSTIDRARRPVRHPSARRLFEVNEWNEEQRRLKNKLLTDESDSQVSYTDTKANSEKLLQDYQQLVDKHDFEAYRRREFIYRHYRCNVREPFLQAKFKQFERADRNRARFKTKQYDQYLDFVNKHRFITRDDYDRREYDAMAQYDNRSKRIQTPPLSDPTLLPYHKWVNETRTVSSLGCRQQASAADHARRDASEQGFRSYHRTATPLTDGRTVQSALSWHMHEHGHIDSSVRRLANVKCSHVEQQSQNPICFDPIDRSLSYLRLRSSTAASSLPCPPTRFSS